MTFLELCQKANTSTGMQGTVSSVTVSSGYQVTLIDFVRQAWVDIQNMRKDWPFMRSTVTFNTVADQSEYTLTNIFGVGVTQDLARWDEWMILYVDANGYNTPLRQWSYHDYITKDASSSDGSIPSYYAIDPVDKHLYLNPPNDAYTITGHYYTEPVSLSANTDTPVLPESFHWLIVYEAAAHMAGFMGNETVFSINRSKADALYGQLLRSEYPAKRIRVVGIV